MRRSRIASFWLCALLSVTGANNSLAQNATPVASGSLEERIEALEKKTEAESIWKTLGLKASGFVDVAYTQNFNNPNSDLNQMHIFDTDANGFMPHLAQIVVERPADAGGSFLDRAGFRARLNFGLDSRVTRARSNYQSGTSNDELDFQELYAEYIVPLGNGLKIQFGKINTLIGYEVINSYENVNFSRSFMFGTSQAFTTTGVRFTYTFSPLITTSFGVVNGWDNVDDNNRGKTIEYLVALTPHERFGLSWYGSYGPEQPNREFDGTPAGNPSAKRFANGLILTFKATNQDTVILEPYYVNEADNPARAATGKANARWNGLAGYYIHDFDEQWSLRLRGEIFEDAGGSRLCTGTWNTGGGTNTCAGASNTTAATPVSQTVWEFTPTLQFKPTPSLYTRLEFRYDKSDKNTFLYGSVPTNHQETLSIEAMYVF